MMIYKYLKPFTHHYIYYYKILYLVLAKKNIQDENFRPDLYKTHHNTVFIIIQLGDFCNYIKVLCNSVIYIFNYPFQNPIRQITYHHNTQKAVGEP